MLKQIHNPYKCSSQKLRTLHALRTTLNLDMLFNMSTLQYADGKRLVAETEGARADMAPGTYEETVGALEKDLVVLAGIIGKVTAFGEGFGVMERRLRGEVGIIVFFLSFSFGFGGRKGWLRTILSIFEREQIADF